MKQNTLYRRQAATIHCKAGATLVAALMLLGASHAEEPQRRQAAENHGKAKAVNPAQAAIEKKLDTIMFPATDFLGVSLVEAVDDLRSFSREGDKSTADPAKRGIKFTIRAPRDFRPGYIRLKLEKVTLRQALASFTEATGTRYEVSEAGVTVLPKDAPSPPKPGDPVALRAAAKKIMIPVIHFENTSMKDAVEFLNQQIKEHSEGAPAFTLSIDASKVDGSTPIKALRLKDVSADEALKYFADATHTMITAGDKELWVTRR